MFSVGLDVEDFEFQFNKLSLEVGSPFFIEEISIEEGEKQNTATILLNDLIAINLIINKSDTSIREVVMIAKGNNTWESGHNIMLTIGTIVAVTNPHLDETERGQALKDLGLLEGLPKKPVSHIIGDTRYTISHNINVAIFFIANNKKDEYIKASQ